MKPVPRFPPGRTRTIAGGRYYYNTFYARQLCSDRYAPDDDYDRYLGFRPYVGVPSASAPTSVFDED